MHIVIYYLVAFLWAVFTGFIFSSIGAAGGILASFGFITVLNIPVANSVKVMSQILVIISPLIALPVYFRQKRIQSLKKVLFYVGFTMAFGAIMGAIFGSWLSKNYLFELKSFKYLFGYLTFIVTALMIYKIVKQRIKKSKKGNVEGSKNQDMSDVTYIGKFSFKKINFKFMSEEHSFSPPILFIAGFLIAIVSSIFGVGGGFLIVPFLTDINGLPAFLAAGTSILVVLIASIVSVSNYVRMGVHIIVPVLLVEIAGIILGSVLGPKISGRLNEKWLKYTLIVLLFFIGLFYVFKP
ncbi:sulfite exporter TauE/SafE family protein [Candidatus Acidulodesulfobacterium sp. H_13]|uniref:sulfite exporter TauE/SafE family protein n=1 Tax=Candidatus Acidulodesulfobacterium sp. H_13 TaxID=3395470 RepID=UPI003AF9206A